MPDQQQQQQRRITAAEISLASRQAAEREELSATQANDRFDMIERHKAEFAALQKPPATGKPHK